MNDKEWKRYRRSLKKVDADVPRSAAFAQRAEELGVDHQTNIISLVDRLAVYRREKDSLEDALKNTQLSMDVIESRLRVLMESTGTDSVTTTSGRWSLTDTLYPVIADKDAYSKWITEHDMDDLRTVNYQTTKGLVRERLEAVEEIPAGIELYNKQSVRRTRKG